MTNWGKKTVSTAEKRLTGVLRDSPSDCLQKYREQDYKNGVALIVRQQPPKAFRLSHDLWKCSSESRERFVRIDLARRLKRLLSARRVSFVPRLVETLITWIGVQRRDQPDAAGSVTLEFQRRLACVGRPSDRLQKRVLR